MITTHSSIWEVGISSVSVIAKCIKEDLLGPLANEASQENLGAEVIRVALWMLSVHKQTPLITQASVTTRSLLELARAIWRPIATAHQDGTAMKNVQPASDASGSKESVEMERELLESLAEQGDLFEISGGRWLPAPMHFVQITPTYHLLVSGMPIRRLPPVLLRTVSFHGSFRYVESSINSSHLQDTQIPFRWQSLESWLGPAQTLEELVRYFDKQELLPVSHQNVSVTSLEAYEANMNGSQYSRWQSLDRVKDGRYLLRSSTPWGIHQYTIGSISNRLLTQQSAVLRQADIRQLCYALDQQAGKPTKARWHPRQSLLILHSELPARERKFLSSIGTLKENSDGNYYPREWYIRKNDTRVFSMLKELGIQIETNN